jgi:phospholipid/cholesterol/gamma-HCH transport system substrate-binding protein
VRTDRPGVVLSVALVLAVLASIGVAKWSPPGSRTHVVAYFDNSNGIYVGDNVIVLGVKVGQIDNIEPQPQSAKISFWIDSKHKIPVDAKAVILSPKLITSRAIQLTPAYTGGPALPDGAVLPKERTVVPVEFDDLRQQLEKLTDSLKPTQPGGTSAVGAFINTTAENLRGQGAHIRDTVIKLSQTVSALGDHSKDIFSTAKNLSTLVSALHDSAALMRQLNNNLASVTALLANDPDEVAHAVTDLNTALNEVTAFVSDNREALGTTTDRLASITTALYDSIDDLKQGLHVAPNVLANVSNMFQPAHGGIAGVLALNQFANPINLVCGLTQAASRLNYEQSAKLCVQYLAPIIKNRQYNFPPLGANLHPVAILPLVGVQARPNEVTYSEDWMRPDFRPSAPAQSPPLADAAPAGPLPGTPPVGGSSGPAPFPAATDPSLGLPGLMLPPAGQR